MLGGVEGVSSRAATGKMLPWAIAAMVPSAKLTTCPLVQRQRRSSNSSRRRVKREHLSMEIILADSAKGQTCGVTSISNLPGEAPT